MTMTMAIAITVGGLGPSSRHPRESYTLPWGFFWRGFGFEWGAGWMDGMDIVLFYWDHG